MNIIFSNLGQTLPLDPVKREKNKLKKADNFLSVGLIETLLRHGHEVYIFGRNDLDKYEEHINQLDNNVFSAFANKPKLAEGTDKQYLINYTNDPNFRLPDELHNLMPTVNVSKSEKESIIQGMLDEHGKLIPISNKGESLSKKYVHYKYSSDNIIPEIVEGDIKFDLLLYFVTVAERNNIPMNMINESSGVYYSPRVMQVNYSSEAIELANKLPDVPLAVMIDDPRSVFIKDHDYSKEISNKVGPYDLLHSPDIVLGQMQADDVYLTKYKEDTVKNKVPFNIKTDRDTMTEQVNVPYRYCPIETLFLMKEGQWDSFRDFRKIEKKKKFILTLHGCGKRDQYVDKWVFPHVEDDFKIYGRWWDGANDGKDPKFTTTYWSKSKLYEKYKDRIECKMISTIEEEMWDTRYTFVPVINAKHSGFITQKFWTTIFYGIIPFCQAEYDTDHLLPLPDICRPKTPQEMWDNMDYLDNNPDEYNKLLDYFYDIITNEKLKNGEFMYEHLQRELKNNMGLDM